MLRATIGFFAFGSRAAFPPLHRDASDHLVDVDAAGYIAFLS